jgi:hypothetical protein
MTKIKIKPTLSLKKSTRLFFRKHWFLFIWIILGIFAVLVLILGVIGFSKNLAVVDKEKDYPLTTLLFMTVQLFFLKSGAQPEPVNWELETARWLSVAVSSGAVIQGLLLGFRKQFQEWLCRFQNRHVIICGFGTEGKFIFKDLINQGNVVIVLDKNLNHEEILKIDHAGGYYLLRDAVLHESFDGIGINRCAKIFITCGMDVVNIQVGDSFYKAHSTCNYPAQKKIDVYVQCRESRVFNVLMLDKFRNKKISFQRFDSITNGVRAFTEIQPFDYLPISFDSKIRVNLIVVGSSNEAESFIIHLARLGAFANNLKPIVTLASPEAKKWEENILFKFPQLKHIIDLEVYEYESESISTRNLIAKLINDNSRMITILISNKTEEKTLSITMECKQISEGTKIPVLINLRSGFSLNEMFKNNPEQRIIPLCITELGCDTVQIIKEKLDEIAKIIHLDYLATCKSQGKQLYDTPANRPWEELDDSYKQSNRDQADHLYVKTRVLGLKISENLIDKIKNELTKENLIEILSKMEHYRWNANRWLEGYRYEPGRKNDILKTHPNLVPWEDLDEGTKDYDRSAVKLLPEILVKHFEQG